MSATPAPRTDAAPRLVARGICKAYGGVHALAQVGFELNGGEVHALVGENGAGKSTLARVIAGTTAPDAGEILLDGARVQIPDALAAQRLGIGLIHQELDLFRHLTVGENVVIGNLRCGERRLVDRRRVAAFARPFLDRVGLARDAREPASALSIAELQLLSIARVLSMQCRILVMDEPTSALMDDAAERLFALIGALRHDGVALVYVSHKMDEIFRLADRITVLRDGRVAGTQPTAATTREEVIRLMVGRPLDGAPRGARRAPGEVVLRVRDLRTRKLQGVSFELRRGEVLGLAGLLGAGRSALGAALVGLDPLLDGEVTLKGRPHAPAGPRAAQRLGLHLLPEDRALLGLMPRMGACENATLPLLRRLSRAGVIVRAREQRLWAAMALRLALRGDRPRAPVCTLSGGNQQKVLMARCLFADPDVLFLDDPTRGVDVGAKEDIHRLIDALVAGGAGVILTSSELPELIRCSDRILVLDDGRPSGLFPAWEVTQETLMSAATRARAPQAG